MITSADHLSRVQELAVVTVHTWVQGGHPSHAATRPGESWLDAAHGPVLDGVFLSTPALVVLLLALVATALVMAARAAGAVGAANPAGAPSTRTSARASSAGRVSPATRAGGR